jgi:hypothetical protein
MTHPVKAESVHPDGNPDGWEPTTGWRAEATEQGRRVVVSCAWKDLPRVYRGLVEALGNPIGVLYRRRVDRRDPKPEGWPGEDLIGLDVPAERVLSLVDSSPDLLYGDARCEVWLRAPDGFQLVLDQDGVIYTYPDAPRFVAALRDLGLEEGLKQTLAQRDYVKHWYRAEADEQEDNWVQQLNLTPWVG